VLSGSGLCDKPIPRPEESYRLWCVIVCDLQTSRMSRPWPTLGSCARKKKSSLLAVGSLTVYTVAHEYFAHACVRTAAGIDKQYLWDKILTQYYVVTRNSKLISLCNMVKRHHRKSTVFMKPPYLKRACQISVWQPVRQIPAIHYMGCVCYRSVYSYLELKVSFIWFRWCWRFRSVRNYVSSAHLLAISITVVANLSVVIYGGKPILLLTTFYH
jgi:hypothetical protein